MKKIIHGDCLEKMKNIDNKSINMILCDLPYGSTQNKWDSIIDLEKLWEQYERIIKDNGTIALTAQTPFDKVLGYSNLKLLKYEWIWQKDKCTGHLNANKMPMKEHENILVFYKKLPVYNPQKFKGNPCHSRGNIVGYEDKTSSNYGKFINVNTDGDMKFPKSIIKFNKDTGLHPTQKPVALFEYLIKTYTNEGDLVLDNCAGSGTTAIACLNLNRNFICIEKDDKYFEVMKNRIKEHIRGLRETKNKIDFTDLMDNKGDKKNG